MPDEVRRLRAPWPSLADEVPHLTGALERDFRFGQRVTRTERGYLLGGTIKGGSSSMWLPATAAQHEAFQRWRALDGFTDDGDRGDHADLLFLLRTFDVDLVNGKSGSTREPSGGDGSFRAELAQVYPLLLAILRQLPPEHLERKELSCLQLGGWGPDAAKGSAYEDGRVFLYDFAVKGARRTFAGLFLHELGHAHEAALSPSRRATLEGAHLVLSRAGAFYGIEYLIDVPSRIAYQRYSASEFMAETYLAYTACGAALREFIERQEDPATADAWRATYATFRETFEGVEYE